jgi:hypothetical protein
MAVAACGTSVARRIARILTAIAAPVANRPALGMVCIAAISLAINVVWARTVHFPLPSVHDEFSYLLAGDTFSHGRLTNPAHPMWKHLETIHEIQQPTYALKYPPGEGMALALGQVLSARPIVGIWICAAAAAAVIYWVLRACMPGGWAMLGALLFVLHPLMLQWNQEYWRGAPVILGGALMTGALVRIFSAPTARNAIFLGTGIFILANTRPFEGFMVALGALSALAIWGLCGKGAPQWAVLFRRIVIPLGAVAILTAMWAAYYNWRVTGNPLRMPYAVYQQKYAVAPILLISRPNAVPAFAFREMYEVHAVWEMDRYTLHRAAPLAYVKRTFVELLQHYQDDTALAFSLIVLPWAIWRDWRLRVALWVLLFAVFAAVIETFIQMHYLAPAMAAFILLIVGSMRRLHAWKRRYRFGQILIWSALLITGRGYAVGYADLARNQAANNLGIQRDAITRRLDQLPGNHLVLVAYIPGTHRHTPPEWVYNAADIDNAKIVWAHDMGSAQNQELLAYFKDRQVWTLQTGEQTGELLPYVPAIHH